MNKDIKKTTVNVSEISKLADIEPAEAPAESVELIDNAMETHEDTNETKSSGDKENDGEPTVKEVVIVRYIGGGVWIDGKGMMWASENKSNNILNERQYSRDEYESRNDLKFMVAYGAMKTTVVGK